MFKKTQISKALLLAFGGSAALVAWPQLAQAQRVEITGSSIKRVETEGALQVQTLTRADIEKTGVQTTEQLLRTVSAMSSSGQTLTSSNVGLSTYGASGVSLRGLGEERTLVLLNGQRLAGFADGQGGKVNVNNIPLAAIERVEILKDGASAIYGSDAMAGVVNFILRKNYQGYELGGTYGTPTASGGGQQYQANVIAGWGDQNKDGWNLTVSGQWSKNRDLLGSDRSFSKSDTKLPYFSGGGTPLGSIQGAWDSAKGQPVTTGSTPFSFSGTGYGNPLAAQNKCGTIGMIPTSGTSALGAPACLFDTGPYIGLLAETETTSLTTTFGARLSDSAEFYGDALWSKTIAKAAYQPSPFRHGPGFTDGNEAWGPAGVDPVLLLRPSNPNYQLAADYLNAQGFGNLVGQDLSITSRDFVFGRRTSEDTSTQTRLVAGVRGEFMNQSYDVSASYNQNKLEGTYADGYYFMTEYARITQTRNDWNPWSLTQTPGFQQAANAAKYTGSTLDGTSKLWTLQGTLSGDVMPLPAGSMQYAGGYQFRRESLETSPAPDLSTGNLSGGGGAIKPIDGARSVNALFGELNIPIVKTVDLNLAARWDNYSDFGNTTNWKSNLRWQPVQSLLLRGSYGTGFRAPTMADLYTPVTPGNTSSIINDPVTGQQEIQTGTTEGGNRNLKAETSNQYSLGLIFQPVKSLAVGIDFFSIEVNDAIAQPSDQETVTRNAQGDPAYAGLVTRDPITGDILNITKTLTNSGRLKTQGWDLDVSYRENLGPGVLSIGLNGTYYTKFDQASPSGAVSQKVGTYINGCGNPVISSTAGLDGYGVVLRYKQYLSATWSQDNWAATIANNYATGYQTECYYTDENPDGVKNSIGSASTWDLLLSYSGIKNVVLSLGARNVFDTEPRGVFIAVSNQFQPGYDASQYDPRGRFVYFMGTVKF